MVVGRRAGAAQRSEVEVGNRRGKYETGQAANQASQPAQPDDSGGKAAVKKAGAGVCDLICEKELERVKTRGVDVSVNGIGSAMTPRNEGRATRGRQTSTAVERGSTRRSKASGKGRRRRGQNGKRLMGTVGSEEAGDGPKTGSEQGPAMKKDGGAKETERCKRRDPGHTGDERGTATGWSGSRGGRGGGW